MENRAVVKPHSNEQISAVNFGAEKVVYVSDQLDDEIDLGQILRNIFSEWKIIALVLLIGSILSLVGSFYLTRAHLVEAIVRLPNINELGDIKDQDILEVSPDTALELFVDHLNKPNTQVEVFEQSALFENLSKDSQLTSSQIFSNIRKNISVSRVKHNYYELEKSEKTPFKEVNLSIISSSPELAADYIQALMVKAHSEALNELSNDIVAVKKNRIKAIKDQLQSLTFAADASRKAEIKRLEEANAEMIAGLQMQIALQVNKAKKDRENQIIRVEEAFNTAKVLNIVDPVTWDDLRVNRNDSQITNEFGGTDDSAPRYFQGTRILAAELNRLKLRQDDKPFIGDLVNLEKKISELKNDPKIAALKARQDDTIYIEKYDELQQELSRLIQTPVNYENVQLGLVSQQPVISPRPTRNPLAIIFVGVFISGILSIFIAILRSAIRKKEVVAE